MVEPGGARRASSVVKASSDRRWTVISRHVVGRQKTPIVNHPRNRESGPAVESTSGAGEIDIDCETSGNGEVLRIRRESTIYLNKKE